MDYLGVLYLTNFIKNEVDDREEIIDRIYKNAVEESDSYKELKALKDRIMFFDNGTGKALFNECNELLKTIFLMPDNNREILFKMKNLAKDIKIEEAISLNTLEQLGRGSVSMVDKERGYRFGEALNCLASSLIYMLLITEGVKGVNGLKWNDNNSLNVKLEILNNDIIDRLSHNDPKVIFWKIEKLRDDREIRFCKYRYRLSYISYDEYLAFLKKSEKLGDNLYMTGSVHLEDDMQTVYAGMGNVISCRAVDCIKNLSKRSLVNDDYFGQVTKEVVAQNDMTLNDLLIKMSDGKMCVVTPEKVCDLMNQFINARHIYIRRRHSQCLLCGKMVIRGMVCKEHFDTHQRVFYKN